jgi:hypothetical protein
MKGLALAMAIACAALAQASPEDACGPKGDRFKVVGDNTQHPMLAPQNGSAVLYVIGSTGGTVSIGIDGSWVGAVSGGTYFTQPIAPGQHQLCARRSTLALVMMVPVPDHEVALNSLDVKSGETYYVSATRFPDGGFKLAVLHPDEGRRLLENAKFGTSSRK